MKLPKYVDMSRGEDAARWLGLVLREETLATTLARTDSFAPLSLGNGEICWRG